MNIAILGYGKMGKEIEMMSKERNHKVVAFIDSKEDWDLNKEQLELADVAIDFSTPESTVRNIKRCFSLNLPIVVGTTAWNEHMPKLKNECLKKNQSLIYASNFSIGVNIFFGLNEYLAKLMNQRKAYDVKIEETHHTEKLDAPSGTAISLSRQILENIDRKTSWVRKINSENNPHQLEVKSNRIEDTTGTHSVKYTSEIDELEIKHTANNRKGFSRGAVIAAEWIVDQKGWFEFKDVIFNKL